MSSENYPGIEIKQKALFNWSGGKDSTLALYHILIEEKYDIRYLMTSVNEAFQRVTMHGVRTELLETQAKSIGLPLYKMFLPENPTMESYETIMRNTLSQFCDEGITHSIFGDINLEDLKNYREKKLAELNLKAVFPLWNRSTNEIIHEFIDLGFKTIVTCVNDKYLGQEFVGRVIDADFLKELPKNVDPCGENGEFHTFVFDGPLFSEKVNFEIGEIVHRKYIPEKKESENSEYDCEDNSSETPLNPGFWYCDLIPN